MSKGMIYFCLKCCERGIIFLSIYLLALIRCEDESAEITLDDIRPEKYSYLHPPKINGTPVNVIVSISSLNIRSVDESDMSFTVSIEFWQNWLDRRLKYPSWGQQKNYTILDSGWISSLWNPNIYFVNAVEGKLNNIITPSSLLWLNRELRVFYGCRVILKLVCEMNLIHFPHDEQKCGLQMASAIFNEQELHLEWPEAKRKIDRFSSLQQFEIFKLERSKCVKLLGKSNVSCLEETVILRRRCGYYLINVYIPTVLIVVMSMLTFWIPYDAVPARVTLGVTSLLTIITKQYQASLPNVSYIVALNVWLSCCIGFVFLSLLEFATVIAMSTKLRNEHNIFPNHPDFTLPTVILKTNGTWRANQSWSQTKDNRSMNRPKKLDYFSRIFFPLLFFIFCVTYWWYYSYR